MRRDPIFHETPINAPPRLSRRRFPTLRSLRQTFIKAGLIWFHGTEFRELLRGCHVWYLGSI
jgi:hypothetical protein